MTDYTDYPHYDGPHERLSYLPPDADYDEDPNFWDATSPAPVSPSTPNSNRLLRGCACRAGRPRPEVRIVPTVASAAPNRRHPDDRRSQC